MGDGARLPYSERALPMGHDLVSVASVTLGAPGTVLSPVGPLVGAGFPFQRPGAGHELPPVVRAKSNPMQVLFLGAAAGGSSCICARRAFGHSTGGNSWCRDLGIRPQFAWHRVRVALISNRYDDHNYIRRAICPMDNGTPNRGKVIGNSNGVTYMAWKTPSVREISVGMEINLYVCATL